MSWRDEGGDGPGGEQSPDDGGETVNQELFLLPGDRGFFLSSLGLLLGVLPPWQIPGAGQEILSGQAGRSGAGGMSNGGRHAVLGT